MIDGGENEITIKLTLAGKVKVEIQKFKCKTKYNNLNFTGGSLGLM